MMLNERIKVDVDDEDDVKHSTDSHTGYWPSYPMEGDFTSDDQRKDWSSFEGVKRLGIGRRPW